MINHYEFGKIIVNNKIYTSDIIICCGNVIPNWWRKEGHKLHLSDIKNLLEKSKPKILIVGCGANSVMEVLDEVKNYCLNHNITLYSLNTYDAINLYNKLVSENKIQETVFCVHLTC